jgi:CRISPR/Cas system Type II protein with McrA/HNH and RuvC-like nuclease domain
MFGSGRASLEVYRPLLVEYQHGDCFYCLRPLKDRSDVDHFIPWSHYTVDFGHNFVLAQGTCNAKKAGRLAATEHLEKWCERNERYGEELAETFQERNIVHDQKASQRVTRWAYKQALRGKPQTSVTLTVTHHEIPLLIITCKFIHKLGEWIGFAN